MGKTARKKKERKRKQQQKFINNNDNISSSLPSNEELLLVSKTLTKLSTLDYEILHCKNLKDLRRSVYAFSQASGMSFSNNSNNKPQWISKISDNLREQNWNNAIEMMKAARIGIIPKLGTLQRWVRDADLASSSDEQVKSGQNWIILDAILRTSQQPIFKSGEGISYIYKDNNCLRIYKSWDPFENENREFNDKYDITVISNINISTVTIEKRWKGVRDLIIKSTDTNVLSSCFNISNCTKIPLPFVDDGFVITNVFSKHECNTFISIAEQMEFVPDAEYAVNKENTIAPGRAAAGVVWLANDNLINEIFSRTKQFLPSILGGGELVGLNARLRVYRYNAGAVYRPHVDGAWPGSGIINGEYTFDAYGDRWSRLTFLIYLNEGFEGGTTTFYGPSNIEGILDGRGIIPRTGNVLVFPHGDTSGALVHEGSEVSKGTKYVIRTDVLYIGKQEASLGTPSIKITGKRKSIDNMDTNTQSPHKIAKI